MNRAVIISGGEAASPEFLKSIILPSDFVICADRGYEYARMASIKPNMIIGDFDSYSDELPYEDKSITIKRLNTHKNETDTFECAKEAIALGYKNFLILCALGKRLDHTFGNIFLLNFLHKNDCKAELRSESERIMLLIKGEHEIKNTNKKTFSLLPFGCDFVQVTYLTNVEYPLNKEKIYNTTSLGISNVFLEEDNKIRIHKGTGILLINYSA